MRSASSAPERKRLVMEDGGGGGSCQRRSQAGARRPAPSEEDKQLQDELEMLVGAWESKTRSLSPALEELQADTLFHNLHDFCTQALEVPGHITAN
ncbi:hypothetical protein E2320_009223 [Naja naja]|nr:hypothetical protein E2320_009223 [Naja naja]